MFNFRNWWSNASTSRRVLVSAILLVLLGGVLSIGVIAVQLRRESNLSVNNLIITNLSDSAFTVTWKSEEAYAGRIIVAPVTQELGGMLPALGKEYFVDDRDLSISDTGDYVLGMAGEVNRYTHHVSVRDLVPNQQYKVYVAGRFGITTQADAKATTLAKSTTLVTPDPAYGKVEGVDLTDAVVVLNVATAEGETPVYKSSSLAANGTYSIDVATFELATKAETVDLVATVMDRNHREIKALTNTNYQPVDTIVIVEENSREGALPGILGAVKALSACPTFAGANKEFVVKQNLNVREANTTSAAVVTVLATGKKFAASACTPVENDSTGQTTYWLKLAGGEFDGKYVAGNYVDEVAGTTGSGSSTSGGNGTTTAGSYQCFGPALEGVPLGVSSVVRVRSLPTVESEIVATVSGSDVVLLCSALNLPNGGTIDGRTTIKDGVYEWYPVLRGKTLQSVASQEGHKGGRYGQSMIYDIGFIRNDLLNLTSLVSLDTIVTGTGGGSTVPVPTTCTVVTDKVVVNTATGNLNVRPKGDGTGTPVAVMRAGAKATLCDDYARNTAFHHVQYEGKAGYISAAYSRIDRSTIGEVVTVDPSQLPQAPSGNYECSRPSTNKYFYVVANNLRIRNSASTSGAIVETVSAGTSLIHCDDPAITGIGNSGGYFWTRVQAPTSKRVGYVALHVTGSTTGILARIVDDAALHQSLTGNNDLGGYVAALIAGRQFDNGFVINPTGGNNTSVAVSNPGNLVRCQADNPYTKEVIDMPSSALSVEDAQAGQFSMCKEDSGKLQVYCVNGSYQIEKISGTQLRCRQVVAVGVGGSGGSLPQQFVRGISAAAGDTITASGKYAFFREGQKFYDINVKLTGTDAKIIYFQDVNNNGIQDAGEEEVESVGGVTLSKEAELQTLNLTTGWNAIHLPLISAELDTASELLKYFSENGAQVYHVARYQAGKFVQYSVREDDSSFGTDFNLVPGMGMFVYNFTAAVEVNVTGQKATSIPTVIATGWNLIGVPADSNYNSESVLNKLVEAKFEATTVSDFYSGNYTSVVRQGDNLFGANFNLAPVKGYFVKVEAVPSDNSLTL